MLLGVVLVLAGATLLFGTYLEAIPSAISLGAFVLVSGLVGIAGALIGRTSAGFFTEIVSSAMVTVLGGLILRYSNVGMGPLLIVASGFFLVDGIVRLASATEFPGLRGIFLVSGAASLALGAAILTGAIEASLLLLGVLIGIELIVDGVTALVIGRQVHPRRS